MSLRRVISLTLACALAACTAEQASEESADAGVPSDARSTADAGFGDPNTLVGTFAVRFVEPVAATETAPAVPGRTSVVGKIYDGAFPELVIWEKSSESGDCVLLEPRVPRCTTPCGGSLACVEDDVCVAYPAPKSAGKITMSGVQTTAGAGSFVMKPIANNYQPAESLAYPAFGAGDSLALSAEGDAVQSFQISAKGIDPFDILTTNLTLARDTSLNLSWNAGGADAQVRVKLDISHHGGSKGKIECETADDGSLELTSELITSLLDLGAAGYPTIIVTRRSTGSTVVAAGRIDLIVESSVERAVAVPGITSCTADEECPEGETCQTDLTCQ